MEKMTITEALAEVSLIQKKVAKKKETVLGNLIRYDNTADPFEKQGGSAKALESEVQSIRDNHARLERIRAAIAHANLNETVTLGEQTKTIHEWLTWKREAATDWLGFLNSIHTGVKKLVDHQAKQPAYYKDADGTPHFSKLITNVDYGTYVKLSEKTTEMIEHLDGKLSLKNATVVIEF